MSKKIRLHRCIEDTKIEIEKNIFNRNDYVEIKHFDDEYFTTLKDISIIIYEMSPVGVVFQLAWELSKLKDFPYTVKQYEKILMKIFKEYKELSDEEAFRRFQEAPNLNLIKE